MGKICFLPHAQSPDCLFFLEAVPLWWQSQIHSGLIWMVGVKMGGMVRLKEYKICYLKICREKISKIEIISLWMFSRCISKIHPRNTSPKYRVIKAQFIMRSACIFCSVFLWCIHNPISLISWRVVYLSLYLLYWYCTILSSIITNR